MLHGGPGFPHDYLEPLEALADERPVVFYDQLGCGSSDRPDDPGLWRVERFVDELAAVRRGLGLGVVHLLGHSWGSMLAADYALSGPPGLQSLILASPPLSIPRWVADLETYRRRLPPAVRAILERHEAAGTVEAPEYVEAAAEFYRRHMCRLSPWPPALMRSFERMGSAVYHAMWGREEWLPTGSLADYDRTNRLAELAVPTLFTCGRYDEATPSATAWYASLVSGAELAVFEQSAHLPHLEEPARYLAVVRDFMRRVEGGMTRPRPAGPTPPASTSR